MVWVESGKMTVGWWGAGGATGEELPYCDASEVVSDGRRRF